jgi:hypothetical protein
MSSAMTTPKDELVRLDELYPDMVRPLLDANYGLIACYAPEVFISSSQGKLVSERYVFRKIVYDEEEIPRFPAFLITAVFSDTSVLDSAAAHVGVVYSTQLFMDVPINLYMEQMQSRHHVIPEDAEDTFVQGALLVMHIRKHHTVHRKRKYNTKPI